MTKFGSSLLAAMRHSAAPSSVPRVVQQGAHVAVGYGIAWIRPDRPLKAYHGLVRVAHARQRRPLVAVRAGEVAVRSTSRACICLWPCRGTAGSRPTFRTCALPGQVFRARGRCSRPGSSAFRQQSSASPSLPSSISTVALFTYRKGESEPSRIMLSKRRRAPAMLPRLNMRTTLPKSMPGRTTPSRSARPPPPSSASRPRAPVPPALPLNMIVPRRPDAVPHGVAWNVLPERFVLTMAGDIVPLTRDADMQRATSNTGMGQTQ